MSQQAEKEEKKKGAAPLPAGGAGPGSGASFSLEQLESLQNTLGQLGMSGSAGAGAAASGGGLAAALASKVGLIIVVGMLGVGAMNMRSTQLKLGMKRAPAVKPRYSGDLSNLPTNPQEQDAIQGVVIGDMTRKGDQAAAEAAAAEAAAKAQADADAAAAAAAGKNASADPGAAVKAAMASSTKAMKSGDLTAKAAKLPLGKANSPFDKKFGALSTSLGAGGGSAASAASFKPNAVAMGEARSLGGAKGPSGLRALGAKGGGRGGRAFGQLMNINGLSRRGAQVGGESGSSMADQGFSNAAGGGSAITGGGAGTTGQGVFIAHHDTNPNGTPINNQNGPEGTQAPPQAGHSNATPWQKYVDIAMYCLLAAGILLALAYVLAQAAKKAPNPTSCWQLTAATWCAYLAIAAGSVAAIMGAIVMGMGQTMNGLMYVAGGALVDYLAYQQLTSEDDKSKEVKASTSTKSAEVGKTVTNGTTTAPAAPPAPAPAPPAPAAPVSTGAPLASTSSSDMTGLDFLGDGGGTNACTLDDPLGLGFGW